MGVSRIETCECGRVWKLKKFKSIARDSDSVTCVCGKEIISWNGGHFWIGELVSEPTKKPK